MKTKYNTVPVKGKGKFDDRSTIGINATKQKKKGKAPRGYKKGM